MKSTLYGLLLLMAGVLFAESSMGQTGQIEGFIYSSDSTASIPGVSIWIEHSKAGSVSNGSGKFLLQKIPTGKQQLVISNLGYQTIVKEINIESNQTLTFNFYLQESSSALNELVIITKGNVGLKNIPGSATYISPKEIQKFNYTDINRTLRAVPGINMQEEDGFGLRPNIGLRGTGVERSSKITIMEDGILMAPAPYADPAAYYFPSIGRIQSLEILKGSSQIKYGPYTTGGAINLISTQIPETLSARINMIGGSFGGRNLHAYAGNAHKNVAYLVETFQMGSDGFKELDGGGNTGFIKKDYVAKLRINTNPTAKIYQSLSFKFGQSNESSNETYLGLTNQDFVNNSNRRYSSTQKDLMQNTQEQISVNHFLKLNKNLSISTVAYRNEFRRNWYKLDKVADSSGTKFSLANVLENQLAYESAYKVLTGNAQSLDNVLYLKANNRSYSAQGLQTQMNYQFKTGSITHELEVGIRYHEDQVDRFQWEDEYSIQNNIMMQTKAGIAGTESNRVNSAAALASFVQYKIRISKLSLTPGIRYENIYMKGKDYGKTDPNRTGKALVETTNRVDVYIPGMGADYQFNAYTSAFAGVHKGFSPPGSKDETQPENSINYEGGIRYTKNALSGQAVLFFNDYRNLLGSDLSAVGGAGTGDLFNAGKVETKGLEFQLAYDLAAMYEKSDFSIPVSVAYTYTDASFKTSFVSSFEDWGIVNAGDEFPYLAQNQFTLSAGFENRLFSFNISGRYMDAMRTAPGQGTQLANEKTDAYFVMDASAAYNLHKNISLFASATNLSNEVYVVARRPAGLRPGMPRAFNIGMKANF
jgi:Fe(3+) dicitrate transport protein